MKKILMSLLVCTCASAFAMDTYEFYDDFTGELSTLITDPVLGTDVPFDSGSDQNGACIVLGYEKGAPGAARSVAYSGSAVKIDAKGEVVEGIYNRYRLRNLVCINKIKERAWTAVLIRYPIHPNSVPFDSKSDQNGACLALGYVKGAPGAARSVSYSESAVVVNEVGLIIRGTYNLYRLDNLICLQQRIE